ncbi:MAG: acyltransferase [Oscillospiraceae bacterium]|nr:acyltransferase [Oscillospiraceae bacterium]
MGYRKYLCFLFSIVLVVTSICSVSLADDTETNGGKECTTPSGITLTIPNGFENILWPGIAENDPLLASYGLNKSNVQAMYEQGGIELQCNKGIDGVMGGAGDNPTSDKAIQVIIFEKNAPSDLNSAYAENIQPMSPASFGNTEAFGYGMIDVNGIPVYKIVSQVSGDNALRLNQYTLVTRSGKIHQISIILMSDPEKKIMSYSDEDMKLLEETSEKIIRSIRLSDELAADVITPESAQPFKMATGEGADNTAEAPSGDKTGTVPENNQARTFFQAVTNLSIPTYIILIALALLLFIGIKPSKLREWQEEPLSLDRSKAIQGFAAVAIIVHHLAQELAENAGAIGFFTELGVLFVGIFFFFSGYGLYTSLKTKENYLKGFLKKRLVTILIPFYMCILVFTAAECIRGTRFTPLQLLGVLSGWSLINPHMWYIVEIAILYLAFYVIYRLIKNRTAATVVMGIFVIAMMAGSLMLAHGKDMSASGWFQGEWWYNSSFLFVIGIIVSKHSEGLRRIARKAYVILLLGLAALLVLLGPQTVYMLRRYSYWSEIPGETRAILDKLRCLSVQLPWIICFVLFLLLIMMRVRFGNPVLKFLGSISLELYLIHNLFLKGLHDGTIFNVRAPGMYCILTILMAIGLATVISGVDKYLIALITGKKKASAEPSLKAGTHIHSIDVMRIVMAFFVVVIHVPFAGKAGEVFITYGKTAVPFFLVVCGYFLYRDDSGEMMKRLIKQTKRIFIFFVASNLFYAACHAVYLRVTEGSFNGMRECFTAKALTDFALYNLSPFSEHLWYLGSLLYALLIMLLLNKLKVMKYFMFTAPLLVAAYVVLSHLGIGTSVQLRNAVLVGLGYTMMGMLIRRFEKKILDHKAAAPVLWILTIICCVTAIVELNGYKQGIAVPFVSCEMLIYLITLLCLKYPDFGMGTFAEWLGRECTLTVYIMHMAVLYLMLMTGNDSFFGKYGAVTVFVVTTFIAAVYKSIKKAITAEKTKA